MMGYGGMEGWGWLGMGAGLAVWVLFIAAIVWAVVALTSRREEPREATPRATVRARYARGEITREQYQAMLEDLR